MFKQKASFSSFMNKSFILSGFLSAFTDGSQEIAIIKKKIFSWGKDDILLYWKTCTELRAAMGNCTIQTGLKKNENEMQQCP